MKKCIKRRRALNGKKETGLDYFCITALEDGATAQLLSEGSPPSVSLEYSHDKVSWTTFKLGSSYTNSIGNKGDKIYIRGNNNAFAKLNTSGDIQYRHFSVNKKYKISGNIMSLLDKTCAMETMADANDYAFTYLFYNSQTLTYAHNLKFGKYEYLSEISKHSFEHMFDNCTELIYAPSKIRAFSIYDNACCGMFKNCINLITTPYIEVSDINSLTFYSMFENCESVEVASRIEIGYVGNSGCEYMFRNCESLTKITDFHIGTVASRGCAYMFYGCSSLSVHPVLPRSISNGAFRNMFMNSHIAPMELPTINIPQEAYAYMYSSKRAQATQDETYKYPFRIPTEGTGTAGTDALKNMFTGSDGNPFTPEINTTFYLKDEPVRPYNILIIRYPVGDICTLTKDEEIYTSPDTTGYWRTPIYETGTWTIRSPSAEYYSEIHISTLDGAQRNIDIRN